MKLKRLWMLAAILAIICGVCEIIGYSRSNDKPSEPIVAQYIPQVPDYSDATQAILHDTITVTLSPENHMLVVSGYSGSEYKPYKNFLNVGDIHSCEPWLYCECLQKNINVRVREWRKIYRSE